MPFFAGKRAELVLLSSRAVAVSAARDGGSGSDSCPWGSEQLLLLQSLIQTLPVSPSCAPDGQDKASSPLEHCQGPWGLSERFKPSLNLQDLLKGFGCCRCHRVCRCQRLFGNLGSFLLLPRSQWGWNQFFISALLSTSFLPPWVLSFPSSSRRAMTDSVLWALQGGKELPRFLCEFPFLLTSKPNHRHHEDKAGVKPGRKRFSKKHRVLSNEEICPT